LNYKLYLLLISGALFGGCASNPDSKNANELPTLSWQDNEATEYIEPRSFNLNQIVSEGHRPKISVHLAAKDDVSVNWPAGIAGGLAGAGTMGALSVGLILLSPMAASAGLIGGSIFVPTYLISGIHSSLDRSGAEQALKQINFIGDLHKQLDAAINKRFSGQTDDGLVLELILLAYGLYLPSQPSFLPFSEYENMFFYCDALIRVTKKGKVVFEDPIVWRAKKRSNDIPPPRYASLHEFSANNALLIYSTFTEASEVIAAVTLKRLNLKP
jgi:hypothetical protein